MKYPDGSAPTPTIPIYVPPGPAAPPTGGTQGGKGGAGKGGAGGAGGAGGGSSTRYLQQAAALEGQIKALKNSISKGFREALNRRLTGIKLSEEQGISLLKEGYASRTRSLGEAEENNTRAAGQSSQEALANRNRERTQLLTEALSQGAGESDVLRAQQVALRNWEQNQGEVQRGFFDTLSSINAGLTDLNVDTKTGFANVVANANGDRDSAWTSFYNQNSEALTQLGNLYGQQGEYYGLAEDKAKQAQAAKASDDAFMRASQQNSMGYTETGQPAWLKQWKGQGAYEADIKARTFDQANRPVTRVKAPQGATLRKWEE